MNREEVKKLMESIDSRTPEEKKEVEKSRVQELIEEFKVKNFKLKTWNPSKDNSNWSHDHCDFCGVHISNKEGCEKEAYTDDKEFDWVCKSCFDKYLKQ